MFPGPGAPAAAGGGSLTLTYQAQATPSYSVNTATATGVSIGTASASRLVILEFLDIGPGQGSNPTVTIGGVSATVCTLSSVVSGGNVPLGIAYAVVPTGTTATISVAYASGVGGNGDFEVYTLTGYSSATPTGCTSSHLQSVVPFSNSVNIATSSGGVAIAGSFLLDFGTITAAGSTATFSTDISGFLLGTDTFAVFSATGLATNASSLVQANYTGVASNNTTSRWRRQHGGEMFICVVVRHPSSFLHC